MGDFSHYMPPIYQGNALTPSGHTNCLWGGNPDGFARWDGISHVGHSSTRLDLNSESELIGQSQ